MPNIPECIPTCKPLYSFPSHSLISKALSFTPRILVLTCVEDLAIVLPVYGKARRVNQPCHRRSITASYLRYSLGSILLQLICFQGAFYCLMQTLAISPQKPLQRWKLGERVGGPQRYCWGGIQHKFFQDQVKVSKNKLTLFHGHEKQILSLTEDMEKHAYLHVVAGRVRG